MPSSEISALPATFATNQGTLCGTVLLSTSPGLTAYSPELTVYTLSGGNTPGSSSTGVSALTAKNQIMSLLLTNACNVQDAEGKYINDYMKDNPYNTVDVSSLTGWPAI